MRNAARWSLRIAAAVLLALGAAATFLAATEAGTRWLFARAEPYLPAPLSIGAIGGTLLAGLRITDLAWQDDAVDVQVGRIDADLDLSAALSLGVGLDSLRAGPVEVRIKPRDADPEAAPFEGFSSPVAIGVGAATITEIRILRDGGTTEIVSLDISGRLQGDRLRLARLAMDSAWLTLEVGGTAEFMPPYRANLRAAWHGVEAAGRGFTGELGLDGRLADMAVRHRLTRPFGVDTEGSVAVSDGAWTAVLDNRWQQLDWPVGPDASLVSRDGQLHIEGNTDRYAARASAAIDMPGWPDARVALDLTGNLAGVAVSALSLDTAAGRVSADGRLDWAPETAWSASFSAEGVDPATFATNLTGTLDADGTVRGRWVDGVIRDGRLVVEQLAGTLLSRPIEVSGEVGLSDGVLDIARLRAASGANALTASGRVGKDLDLRLKLDARNLAELDDRAAGRLEVDGIVGGTFDAPAIRGSLRAASAGWGGLGVETVEAELQLDERRAVTFSAAGENMTVASRRVDRFDATIEGTLERHRIAASASGLGIDTRLNAVGSYADKAWRGSLDALALSSERLGSWRSAGPVAVSAAPGRADLDLLCLDRQTAAGQVCVEFGYAPDEPLDLAASLSGLPLAALGLPMPAGTEVEGTLFLEASGEIAGGVADGSASLEIRDASLSATIDEEPETVRFDRLTAGADLIANRLEGSADVAFGEQRGTAAASLAIADIADPGSEIAGTASVRIGDLSFASVLIPVITEPTGVLAGSLSFAGTRQAPRIAGEVALRETAFGVPAAGIEIRELELVARQLEPGTLSLDGSASSGDGIVTITGRTAVDPERGLATTLDIEGSRFELIELPDLRVLASPDVSVVIDEQQVGVSGALDLPAADVLLQTLPEAARRKSPDAIVHGRDAATGPARRASLDLRVGLGDDVRFAGYGLTTGLTGSLRLRADPGAPLTGSGRISLEGGRYEAYGQDLEVERGELIFNGPLTEPLLDVRAVRRMTEVTAGIHLTGPPNRLQSEVFSEPPLTDAEALSYLLTGHGLERTDTEEGDLLNKAAFALGVSRAGSVASEVRSSLGLETLTVSGGADDARIVAGKRIGGNLLLEYGYGLVDQLGTLIIKYQLNERIVLESSTGSVSSLDVFYRVRRK